MACIVTFFGTDDYRLDDATTVDTLGLSTAVEIDRVGLAGQAEHLLD